MGGMVGGAELARPPAGQRLALVASGEEGELARVAAPDGAQPIRRGRHRLVPFDLLIFAAAARPDPAQRFPQPGRRIVIHDPGRALGAEHALVHRVVAVALDVANAAVLQMNLDAAAAGAHVAGGGGNLVGAGSMEIQACCLAVVGQFPILRHHVLAGERLISAPCSKKKIILRRRVGPPRTCALDGSPVFSTSEISSRSACRAFMTRLRACSCLRALPGSFSDHDTL